MKFFHISTFDKGIQKVLVPHVPDKTLWEEDIETKRISVCSNIDGCIAGISLNEYMYNEGKILIYEIEVDENMEHVFSWEVLYEKYNVYDAPFTHEYWVTCCVEPIKVYEGIVSNVKKNKYILASNVYKEKIICELKRLGLFEENMLRMNVFEISNYSGEHVKEAVKNILKIQREEDNSELYRKVFGKNKLKEFDYMYTESSYITKYDLRIREI